MPRGAYVALPDADTTPDVPPGYPVNWPFPPSGSSLTCEGPFPPGYEPVYTIDLAGSNSVTVGSSYSAAVTLYDHGTYTTSDPICGSNPDPTGGDITWTATMDGAALLFTVDGDASALEHTTNYADLGDFYGDAVTIIFDIDASDEDKTIVLSVAGHPFGYDEITDTQSITVVAVTPAKPESIVANMEITSYTFGVGSIKRASIELEITRTGGDRDWVKVNGSQVGNNDETWTATEPYNEISEITCTPAAVAKTIDASGTLTDNKSYTFEFKVRGAGNTYVNATIAATVTFDDASTEIGTATVALVPYSSDEIVYLTVSLVGDGFTVWDQDFVMT